MEIENVKQRYDDISKRIRYFEDIDYNYIEWAFEMDKIQNYEEVEVTLIVGFEYLYIFIIDECYYYFYVNDYELYNKLQKFNDYYSNKIRNKYNLSIDYPKLRGNIVIYELNEEYIVYLSCFQFFSVYKGSDLYEHLLERVNLESIKLYLN